MDLLIQETKNTPKLWFDSKQNEWSIMGKSYPREANEFYRPLRTWIDDFEANANDEILINFKLEFFNTITTHTLINILVQLREKKEKNNIKLKIKWYYESDDEDMFETGEYIMQAAKVKFEMICVE